jgi:HAE1 family hydrophobic/amphiphilic exporter-1
MVASLIFKANKNHNAEGKAVRKAEFERARKFYRKLLQKSLKRRGWILAGVLGLFLLSFVIVPFLGTEFMPSQDQDMIILNVKMPVGTSIEETNRVAQMVEEVLVQQPEVKTVSAQIGSAAEEDPSDLAGGFSNSGTHEGIIWVGLVSQTERKDSDLEIMERIRKKLPQLKGVKFEVMDMSQMMMGGSSAPVEIKVFGKDIYQLREVADNIVDRIQDVEGLRDITHTFAQGKPEYHIRINREKASRMGLMVSQIANTIQTASLGKVATRYREGNDEVDIRVRFRKQSRDSLDDIENIPILTSMNRMVRLNQVASISRGEGPIQIDRENQARVVTVLANIAGRDLGSVVKDIKQRIGGVERGLPPGYFIEFGGQFKNMQEAFVIMAAAFALAILLVYMIMASQFESFRHPFVIMFTIPLALFGVIVALLVSGKPISLPVLIGFIMLGGIAVNNGIVMVDYINQLKRRGVEKKEAILQACTVRLRPVLITAFTTILGMLPMALSTSQGSEMRAPMAITVVGGLIATTLLTLFVIPIMYSLLDRVSFKQKKA